VIDLGAWPGGWLQVALERVGAEGKVVGVDLAEIVSLDAPNAELLVGDVRDPNVIDRLRELAGGSADVVLSDAAPKLTGVRATDEARSEELTDAVLAALPGLLRPGGRLAIKLFMGPGHRATVSRIERAFSRVKVTRADSSRQGSAELYAVAHEFQGIVSCG
jgi:23S rRNA (uridine2552-2'-O)-methyltransferase